MQKIVDTYLSGLLRVLTSIELFNHQEFYASRPLACAQSTGEGKLRKFDKETVETANRRPNACSGHVYN